MQEPIARDKITPLKPSAFLVEGFFGIVSYTNMRLLQKETRSGRCQKVKLLRYFRHSASVTYRYAPFSLSLCVLYFDLLFTPRTCAKCFASQNTFDTPSFHFFFGMYSCYLQKSKGHRDVRASSVIMQKNRFTSSA